MFDRNLALERVIHVTRTVIENQNLFLIAAVSMLNIGVSWSVAFLVWLVFKVLVRRKV